VTNEEIAAALSSIQSTLNELLRARRQSESNQRQTATDIKKLVLNVSAVKVDVAVLKTQHANFWKGVTVVGTIVTGIAAFVGWAISQISLWLKG